MNMRRPNGQLYSYAKFSKWDFGMFRWLGPGLGNLLFPWGRAVMASHQHGLTMVAPTWPQIKLGTLLRGERDGRFYFHLFSAKANYAQGWKKAMLLCGAQRLGEMAFLQQLKQGEIDKEHRARMVVFDGIRNGFRSLPSDARVLWDEFLAITRETHRADKLYQPGKAISMHIRLGDFQNTNKSTPITWFVNVVERLRSKLGESWPIHVFSDGQDHELAPVLAIPGCRRVSFGSSVADLLAMSRANVLIASKLSTLNMWGFYFGRMPVIWPPDTDRFGLETINPELQFLESGNETLSGPLFARIQQRVERLNGGALGVADRDQSL